MTLSANTSGHVLAMAFAVDTANDQSFAWTGPGELIDGPGNGVSQFYALAQAEDGAGGTVVTATPSTAPMQTGGLAVVALA